MLGQCIRTNRTPQSGLLLCWLVTSYSHTLLKEDRERRLPVHERKPAKSLRSTLNAHAALAVATSCYSVWANLGFAVSTWVSFPLPSVVFSCCGRSTQMVCEYSTEFRIH